MINYLIFQTRKDGDGKRLQCLITLKAVKLLYSEVEISKLSATGTCFGLPVAGLSTSLWGICSSHKHLWRLPDCSFTSLQLVDRIYSQLQVSFLGSISFVHPSFESPVISQQNSWYVNKETHAGLTRRPSPTTAPQRSRFPGWRQTLKVSSSAFSGFPFPRMVSHFEGIIICLFLFPDAVTSGIIMIAVKIFKWVTACSISGKWQKGCLLKLYKNVKCFLNTVSHWCLHRCG